MTTSEEAIEWARNLPEHKCERKPAPYGLPICLICEEPMNLIPEESAIWTIVHRPV